MCAHELCEYACMLVYACPWGTRKSLGEAYKPRLSSRTPNSSPKREYSASSFSFPSPIIPYISYSISTIPYSIHSFQPPSSLSPHHFSFFFSSFPFPRSALSCSLSASRLRRRHRCFPAGEPRVRASPSLPPYSRKATGPRRSSPSLDATIGRLRSAPQRTSLPLFSLAVEADRLNDHVGGGQLPRRARVVLGHAASGAEVVVVWRRGGRCGECRGGSGGRDVAEELVVVILIGGEDGEPWQHRQGG